MMVKVFPSLLVTLGVDCKPVTSWFVGCLVGWLCVLVFCPSRVSMGRKGEVKPDHLCLVPFILAMPTPVSEAGLGCFTSG